MMTLNSKGTILIISYFALEKSITAESNKNLSCVEIAQKKQLVQD